MNSRRTAALLVVAATGALAACHAPDYLSYDWDSRRVLCSDSFDDLTEDVSWNLIEDEIAQAETAERVVMFHAHKPGATVSMDAIERMLALADAHHLDYVQFRDLHPGPPRAGLALAFDDDAVDSWVEIHDLLAQHGAHVTFFVTRYETITDDQRAELDQLAADGHDLEPHTVHHLHAHDYLETNSLDDYMADEVLPSIELLQDAGYPASAFAYPFGEHTDAMDQAILQYVDTVRTTPGECPY